jgi:glycosyltransferase involved in cell wall biosynthesis
MGKLIAFASHMPRVTVIIPTYNSADSLADAIDSVLRQRFHDFELLVVNDGSTDHTRAVLDRYGERIGVVEQNNRGIGAARNAGLKLAHGEYVAFLDADDCWHPDMLEQAASALDAELGCVLAYSNCELVDWSGRSLTTTMIGADQAHPPSLEELLHRLWPIMPSAVLMRRSVLHDCGGFSELFRGYGFEDVHCWLLARERGRFAYLPDPLVRWRVSPFSKLRRKQRDYPEASRIFARLVHERYGVSAAPLIESRRRAPRSILGYTGLLAMRAGDRVSARAAFLHAVQLDPFRLRNYLRFVRTFLPSRLARALTGRTSQLRNST